MKKQSVKTAARPTAGAGKYPQATLPPMPLVRRFEMGGGLARDLQKLATEIAIPPEYLIQEAIRVMIDSDDGPNREGSRENYIIAAKNKTRLEVRSLEGGAK